jgi:hypothetical protein
VFAAPREARSLDIPEPAAFADALCGKPPPAGELQYSEDLPVFGAHAARFYGFTFRYERSGWANNGP